MLPCAITSTRPSKIIDGNLLLACVLGHGWLQKRVLHSISVSTRGTAARFHCYVHGSVHCGIDAWSREFARWARKHAICMVFAPSVGDVFACGGAASEFYCYSHSFSTTLRSQEPPETPKDTQGIAQGPPGASQGPQGAP